MIYKGRTQKHECLYNAFQSNTTVLHVNITFVKFTMPIFCEDFQKGDYSPLQLFILVMSLRKNVRCNCMQCCNHNVIRSLPESATCEHNLYSVLIHEKVLPTGQKHMTQSTQLQHKASTSYCTFPSWQRSSGIH